MRAGFALWFVSLAAACASDGGSGGTLNRDPGDASGGGGNSADGSGQTDASHLSTGSGGSGAGGSTTSSSSSGGSGSGGGASGGGLSGAGGSDAGPDGSNVDAASGGSGVDAAADGSGVDAAASPTIAATPPMGWNSWESFQCNLSDALIRGIADTMATSGMQAAGYQYVNLDDCWMNGRDANGSLRWDSAKFPSGIPALASYIHAKGLKFGIYQSANTRTCVGIYAGVPASVAAGSLGHEAQDAATFASWGVDFLKYDLCAGDLKSIVKMRDGLRATGRPIVYSINPGNRNPYPPNTPGWDVVSIANMWRIAFDISTSYASVTSIIDLDAPFFSYAGPGHWNDADGLEVGKGLSVDEDRSQFSMWALLASPLLAGNDIRSMSTTTRDILTNAEVIAVDQDPLGKQGQLVATPQPNVQIWSKTLSQPNTRAVALLNRTGAVASATVQWTAVGLPAGRATVHDLWTHMDLGTFAQSFTANAIPRHGVVMLRVTSVP